MLCVAGIFARTNMGQSMPERDEVQRALTAKIYNLDTFVVWFCQDLMESDDHYDLFMGEAQMWCKTLTEMGDKWKVTWADHWELVKFDD